MYKFMNTKTLAAFAVFAMVFAGFGMMVSAEANDADEAPVAPVATKTFTMVFEGVYLDPADEAVAYLATGGVVKYAATLDEDFEEKITVLTKDYYDAMKAYCSIKGDAVTFQMDANGKVIDKGTGAAGEKSEDALQGLIIFTSFEVSKTDEISGVTTQIVIANALVTKDVTYDLVFEDDAEAAIAVAVAIAVAEAVAEVEAEYADYLSPEEVQDVVDTEVAKVISKYKDYKSPAEVKAACDKAIEDYIATHPVKKDDTFLYVTIVLAAVVIALAGFMVFDKVIKPKMAKKDEIQVI